MSEYRWQDEKATATKRRKRRDLGPIELAEREAGAPEAAEPRSRSELLRLAGDAVEPITLHCQTCETCRPEAFVGDVVELPLCREGLVLRRDYREARRQALDACGAAGEDEHAQAS